MNSSSVEHQKIVYDENSTPFVCHKNKRVDSFTKAALNMCWHEELEIKYIIDGRMTITVDNTTVVAQKGDIIIVNPCEYHNNLIADGDNAVYHLLCVDLSQIFNGGIIERYYPLHKNNSLRFKTLIRGDEELNALTLSLFDSFNSNASKLQGLGLFLTFFAKLERHLDVEKIKRHSDKRYVRQNEVLRSAFSYIHTHINEVIDVSEIAKMCFITQSHFCRIFKELTGETPINYINKLKINKAITLLTNTNLTITQIANSIGFDDNSYFCRCFKKHTGLSASAYLNKHKQGKASSLLDHSVTL